MSPAQKRKAAVDVDQRANKTASDVSSDEKEDGSALTDDNGSAATAIVAAPTVDNGLANVAAQSVRMVLECPVCLEVRRHTHVLQCTSGHNICAVCKDDKSVVVCPTCRQGYNDPPARIFAIESLIEASDLEDFACRYAGCGFRGRRAQMDDHEDDCGSRKVPCPNSLCHQKVVAQDMLQHVRDDHKKTIWKRTERNSWQLKADLTDAEWTLGVSDFDGHTFVCRFKKLATTGYYHSCVVVLGGPKAAAGYSVEITTSGNKSELKKVCKVHAVDREETDITAEEDCYVLAEPHVKQMRTANRAEENTGYSHLITTTHKIQKKADRQ